MPLFQPSNITPSSFAGVGGGTVAVSDNVKIVWQVNGNVPMTAFKIIVYDENNNVVNETELESLATPFYPTDNKGNPQYFVYNPEAVTWEDWGLVDGQDYTMQIIQYWGYKTDLEHTVSQVSRSFFITRTKPSIEIIAGGISSPSEIHTGVQTFNAVYSQEQEESVEWVRWKLYDITSSVEVLLSDTDEVNTQNLEYKADGLQNERDYRLECEIQTVSGVLVETAIEFSVSYTIPTATGIFTVSTKDKASNELSWSELAENVGVNISGRSQYNQSYFEGNKLVTNNDAIIWDEKIDGETKTDLDIHPDWTLAWRASSKSFLNGSETVIADYEQDRDGKLYTPATATVKTPDNYRITAVYPLNSQKGFFFCREGSWGNLAFGSLLDFSMDCFGRDTSEEVYSIEYLEKGNTVLGISAKLIYFYKFNKEEPSIKLFDSLEDFPGGDWVLTWTSDKEKYVWVGDRSYVTCYDVSGDELVVFSSFKHPYSKAPFLQINPDGQYLFLWLPNEECKYVYIGTPEAMVSPEVKGTGIIAGSETRGMAFSDVLGIVAIGSTVYEYSSGKIGDRITTLQVGGEVVCPRFNDEGNVLMVGQLDGIEYYAFSAEFRAGYLGKTRYTNTYTSEAYPTSVFVYNNGQYSALNGKSQIHFGSITTGLYLDFEKSFEDRTIYGVSSYLESYGKTAGYITNEDWSGGSFRVSAVSYFLEPTLYSTISWFGDRADTPIEEEYISIRMGDRTMQIVRKETEIQVVNDDGESIASQVLAVGLSSDILVTINANAISFYQEGVGDSQAVSLSIDTITSVALTGYQETTYLYITEGNATVDLGTIPIWGAQTKFLTNFNLGNLQAGEIEVVENVMDIYRETLETGEILKIHSFSTDIQKARDFSWLAGLHYRYFGRIRFEERYAASVEFKNDIECEKHDGYFSRQQSSYYLIEATQDEAQPTTYHVISYWRFGNNVSAGSVSNNNSPSFLQNFTPYRLKQPTSQLGKSGVLTALLSNTRNGEYEDNAQEMEELFNLSKSSNTFFLKDTKGNMYMVAISGAITQTINTNSTRKEVSVSIPWEEVGSCKGISVIQTSLDEEFGETERN